MVSKVGGNHRADAESIAVNYGEAIQAVFSDCGPYDTANIM